MKTAKMITATAMAALLVAGCSRGSMLSLTSGPEREAEEIQQEVAQPSELLIALGDAAMGRGQAENAALYYSRALEAEPNNSDALAKLGHALMAQRIYGQAEQSFRQALAADSNNANALYGLGKLYIVQDRAADAAVHFSQAIAAAQGRDGVHRIYNGLGIALDMQGDHAGAQQAYATGLDQAPGDLTLRNNMALSLAAVGDYERAITLMEAVARDGQATARHRQNLAMIYGLAGRDADAAAIATQDLDPAQAEANVAFYGWLRRSSSSSSAGRTAEE